MFALFHLNFEYSPCHKLKEENVCLGSFMATSRVTKIAHKFESHMRGSKANPCLLCDALTVDLVTFWKICLSLRYIRAKVGSASSDRNGEDANK